MSAPFDLAAVIAAVESNNNPQRLRFERWLGANWDVTPTPARAAVIRTIVATHACSHDSAVMLACTSWGRYQLLGENIYSSLCGPYVATIFDFVADAAAQRFAFDRFLRHRGIFFSLDEITGDRTKREQFIAAYNGPGAMDTYWARMQQAMAALAV